MAAYGTFTLTGTYLNLDGSAASGKVRLDGIPQVIVDSGGDKVFVGPRTLILDAAGRFSVTLPTDAASGGADSTTIGYRVKFGTGAPTEFYAPAADATLDMADVTSQSIETPQETAANAARAETAAGLAESYASDAEDQVVLAESARDDAQDAAASATAPTDTTMAAKIQQAGSATQVALNNAIASFRLGQSRLVFLGDSTTIGPSLAAWPNADVNKAISVNTMRGDSYPTYAALASDGRWREVANAGIGGNTSAQMLARFQADVIDAGATGVVVLAGMNDAGTFTLLSTYAANMTAIAQAAVKAKIAPIFVTVTPSTNGTTQSDGLKRRQFITTYNAWLANFCAANNYPLINVHDALVNTTDGSLAAAYDAGDGVHQNYAGRQVVGSIVAAALTKILPPAPPPLINNAADANDMLAGIGMFASGATIGTGWSNYHTATGATWSRVTDPMILGSMQRLTMAGATDYAAIAKTITTGWAVGDRLALSGIVSVTGNIGVDVQMLFSSSTGQTRFDPVNVALPVRRGFVYGEVTVPPGTTAVWVLLRSFSAASGLGGTGTVDFGQIGLRNLTTEGIA